MNDLKDSIVYDADIPNIYCPLHNQKLPAAFGLKESDGTMTWVARCCFKKQVEIEVSYEQEAEKELYQLIKSRSLSWKIKPI